MTTNAHYDSASIRLQQIIHTIEETQAETIKLKQIVAIVGRRAFSIIIIIFALFNILPVSIMPGVSFVTGLPIAFIGMQIFIGRGSLWLPDFLANKGLPAHGVVHTLQRSLVFFKKMEYLLKPRLAFFFSTIGLFFLGLFILLLSVALMLPIPFSNHIIGGILILLALSLLEYDGYLLLFTLAMTAIYFFIIWNLGVYLWSWLTGTMHP